jgi:hypothetical protein
MQNPKIKMSHKCLVYFLSLAVSDFGGRVPQILKQMKLMELTKLLTCHGIANGDCDVNNSDNINHNYALTSDRLCGLVARVLGYRSGGPGSIPGTARKKK